MAVLVWLSYCSLMRSQQQFCFSEFKTGINYQIALSHQLYCFETLNGLTEQ